MKQTRFKELLSLVAGMAILRFFQVEGLGSFGDSCEKPEQWDALRTTYNLTTVWSLGISHWMDQNVPGKLNRTATIARNSTCVNDVGSTIYFGHRVNQDGNNSVVVLYDVNGIVAGIQIRFRKDEVLSAGNEFQFSHSEMFQTEEIKKKEYFVLTAYFVEPDIICTTGRTADQLNRLEGTGKVLYIQSGPTPTHLFEAPLTQNDAIQAGFSKNECYPGIGHHSFMNSSFWSEENCAWATPLFLVYNDCGHLIGFGFLWKGCTMADRFEHPSPFGISAIVGAEQTPKCLSAAANTKAGGPGLSSLHIWFVDRNPGCPLSDLASHMTRAVSQYWG